MSIIGNLDTRVTPPLAEDPAGGEVEPTLIPALSPTPARLGLYGDHGERQAAHAVEVAESTNLQAIKSPSLDEKILAAIQVQREFRYHVPFWVTGDGAKGQTRLQAFPFSGQWLLETIIGWADPAASADLTVAITLDQSVPIPFALALSHTDIVSRPIGLPVAENDLVQWVSSGGVAGDRGVVILVFKRSS